MKTNLKRKNYYLDEEKYAVYAPSWARRPRPEALDAALNLVVFRKEFIKSLEKVRAKVVWKRFFNDETHLIDTDLYIDLIQSGTTLPFIGSSIIKMQQRSTSAPS